MERKELVVPAGGTVAVTLDGPAASHSVLVLPDDAESVADCAALCERLHNSELRTIVIEHGALLPAAVVDDFVDSLGLTWVNLVGSGTGATLAWKLASERVARYRSLTVFCATDIGSDCPTIELPTTMIITDPAKRAQAQALARLVYADFRLVELPVTGKPITALAREIATEVVLRTSPW